MKLKITISKTSDGHGEYVQVMSDDAVQVNVVLVAEAIEIVDARPHKTLGVKPRETKRER